MAPYISAEALHKERHHGGGEHDRSMKLHQEHGESTSTVIFTGLASQKTTCGHQINLVAAGGCGDWKFKQVQKAT